MKGQGIFSLDIIKIHTRLASCKDCFHISNRPLPIHVQSHEISKFLDTETLFLLKKCCQSASLLKFKGKKMPMCRAGFEPGVPLGVLEWQSSTLTTRPQRNRFYHSIQFNYLISVKLFAGTVFLQNVVAKYYVMFL